MSKEASQIHPNRAAIYAAALYPDLATVFQKHGYALAVHGSLARDLDLIAVPWAEKLSSPEDIIQEITSTYAIKHIGKPDIKRYGRVAYAISFGFGECYLDVSFFPGVSR